MPLPGPPLGRDTGPVVEGVHVVPNVPDPECTKPDTEHWALRGVVEKVFPQAGAARQRHVTVCGLKHQIDRRRIKCFERKVHKRRQQGKNYRCRQNSALGLRDSFSNVLQPEQNRGADVNPTIAVLLWEFFDPPNNHIVRTRSSRSRVSFFLDQF